MFKSLIPCNSYEGYDATMPNRETGSDEAFAKEISKTFARNFRQARREVNLSQTQVATRAGLCQPFISQIETNQANVSVDNAAKLADAVGRPLWMLLKP